MPHDHAHSDHDHHDHHDRAAPAHDHGHAGHAHSHAPTSFGAAFLIGIALNAGFVVIEAVFGWLGHSVALLADAGHNFSDVLGLIVAYAATLLAARRPTARFTYGLRGSSILAALFNALFLMVAVGAIAWEAVLRLGNPEPVAEVTVMVVAAIGILVNGGTALLFMSGQKGDLNVRGAFLHMAADAGVSLGVVIAAVLIGVTGWQWLDPLTSLLICAVIIWSTWSLLRASLAMSLAAVPESVDPAAVRTFLASRPGIVGVHDLHIWPMSTTEIALTAHLVTSGVYPGDAFLHNLAEDLEHRFGIAHPTVQIETEADAACELKPDHVV